jgi:hypothetical protein
VDSFFLLVMMQVSSTNLWVRVWRSWTRTLWNFDVLLPTAIGSIQLSPYFQLAPCLLSSKPGGWTSEGHPLHTKGSRKGQEGSVGRARCKCWP